MIVACEATDRNCGKRLKAALPHLVESMERNGHLDLARLLKPFRTTVSGRRKRQWNLSLGRNIPVRTFADWNRPSPGFLGIDLVAHCSDNMAGSFIFSPVATDVCTGWTEAVPLAAREQFLVASEQIVSLQAIAVRHQLVDLLGVGGQSCHRALTNSLVHRPPATVPPAVQEAEPVDWPTVRSPSPIGVVARSNRGRTMSPPPTGTDHAGDLPGHRQVNFQRGITFSPRYAFRRFRPVRKGSLQHHRVGTATSRSNQHRRCWPMQPADCHGTGAT